jgi:phospholipase C
MINSLQKSRTQGRSARRTARCSKTGASSDVPNGTDAPGGCTEDLVHRFHQEQYQINGDRQNRYVTGSDTPDLTRGYYDTTKLPIFTYLHSRHAPSYVIADNFFQGGFCGSFLNHQVLVAAQAPVFPDAEHSELTTGCATGAANCDLHLAVDANGMPTSYPYYSPRPEPCRTSSSPKPPTHQATTPRASLV